ncbi:MAG TPA: hypothetical protein VLW47_09860 [Thermodesulfobacteriota bacterium]|nr:hypothetical protein [Thermodesulfobacteriota bacterium]
MDLHFLYFVIFSFILISLILSIIFFTDELRQIKGGFRLRQSIVYILGTLFILMSIPFSYFIYLHGPIWLAFAVFGALTGAAVYFLYRASTIMRDKEWRK